MLYPEFMEYRRRRQGAAALIGGLGSGRRMDDPHRQRPRLDSGATWSRGRPPPPPPQQHRQQPRIDSGASWSRGRPPPPPQQRHQQQQQPYGASSSSPPAASPSPDPSTSAPAAPLHFAGIAHRVRRGKSEIHSEFGDWQELEGGGKVLRNNNHNFFTEPGAHQTDPLNTSHRRGCGLPRCTSPKL